MLRLRNKKTAAGKQDAARSGYKGLCIGIEIGGSFIKYAAVREYMERYRLAACGMREISGDGEAAAGCLREILRPYADEYAVIQAALPGPDVKTIFFDVSGRGRGAVRKNDFLEWRFHKIYGGREKLECRAQQIAEKNGMVRVMAAAAERRLTDSVKNIFIKAGAAPAVIDSGVNFCFNAFYEDINRSPGALIVIEQEYRGLIIWDENRTPFYINSWRSRHPGENTEKNILEAAADAERIIRNCVSEPDMPAPEKIYFCGSDFAADAGKEILNRRIEGGVINLRITDRIEPEAGVNTRDIGAAVLCAAVKR
ncbi:MAG: hypothetical protein ACLFP1_03380 [Candidatus Goldiibacteriota bacterium]